MVCLMVLVGGTTRLTGSGLSMVEWQPLMGAIPPIGEAQWHEVFDKYKQSPQYQEVNTWMQLSDFKRIFFWEYIHRLLGRSVGLVFALPWIFFVLRKRLTTRLRRRTFVAFVLGGLQGLLGWYMVKSGLVDIPKVSHLRLAAHLSLALLLGMYVLWIILDLLPLAAERRQARPNAGLRNGAIGLVILTGIQIVWGAFMAGSHAGYMFRSFPLMDGHLIAPGSFTQGGFFTSMVMDPLTIHTIHRWFAYVVVAAVLVFAFRARGFIDTPHRKGSLAFLLTILGVQFLLGVFTVLLSVPTALGVAHQFGGLLLLAAAVMTTHAFSDSKNH